jgi:hypothetical protein
MDRECEIVTADRMEVMLTRWQLPRSLICCGVASEKRRQSFQLVIRYSCFLGSWGQAAISLGLQSMQRSKRGTSRRYTARANLWQMGSYLTNFRLSHRTLCPNDAGSTN